MISQALTSATDGRTWTVGDGDVDIEASAWVIPHADGTLHCVTAMGTTLAIPVKDGMGLPLQVKRILAATDVNLTILW